MGIGQNIRHYRKKAGLTQVEFAKLLGYKNYTSITKIESNQRDIPLSTVAKMAEILNVAPSAFFFPIPEVEYDEYIPFLRDMEQKDPAKLRVIREMLGMPEKKSASDSSAVV